MKTDANDITRNNRIDTLRKLIDSAESALVAHGVDFGG
jgi:hypothetical protein